MGDTICSRLWQLTADKWAGKTISRIRHFPLITTLVIMADDRQPVIYSSCLTMTIALSVYVMHTEDVNFSVKAVSVTLWWVRLAAWRFL